MNEIWKPAVGYESSYMVSNLGRVKTIPRRVMTHNNGYIDIPELIKTQPKNNQGYAQVGLKHNGVSSRVFVHRLVATTFIPNPNNLPCVNHKDEDITNNCVDNLEWCSYKYNSNYGTGIKKMKTKLKGKKPSNMKPITFRGVTYESVKAAWDADIQKRLLRTKAEPGMTMEESRKLDYQKIIHVCQERINILIQNFHQRFPFVEISHEYSFSVNPKLNTPTGHCDNLEKNDDYTNENED